MCTQATLDIVTSKVIQAVQYSLGDKLDKVILYGSYARGNHDDESDIDIMVLANITPDDANRLDMTKFTSRLGLEHDVVISLFIKDCETFNRFLPIIPFYQNVLKDGVVLSA
ncbi:MAG: nucleotidyltransferase domain-containing protein [Lachnospiraceae bacterium]|jgi:predicted nucleotidyltransferase|nr:nucleotidyltransferase domain-containing protein [Lachnospiraceae bacterium]